MGADHAVREHAGLELLDEERPAHVEELCGLDRGELRVQRDHRHAVAGLQRLDDGDQEIMDLPRELDTHTVSDQARRLRRSARGAVECALEGVELLGTHRSRSDFDDIAHVVTCLPSRIQPVDATSPTACFDRPARPSSIPTPSVRGS
jgi:hypothetical protein